MSAKSEKQVYNFKTKMSQRVIDKLCRKHFTESHENIIEKYQTISGSR